MDGPRRLQLPAKTHPIVQSRRGTISPQTGTFIEDKGGRKGLKMLVSAAQGPACSGWVVLVSLQTHILISQAVINIVVSSRKKQNKTKTTSL